MKRLFLFVVILSLFICQNAFAKQRKFLEVKTEGNYDVLFEEKTYSINDNTQTAILEENISEDLMPLIWYSAINSDVNLFGNINVSVLGEKIISFTESEGHPVLAMLRAGVTTQKQLVITLEVAINSGTITIGDIHIAGKYFLLKSSKLNQ